ncbi:hypothetical protein WICMUC_001700 [Wickerhamomyces mucosus]|uniref:Aprataxin C2HE/C2H2/C2HC zinc finger domain-containing protein n=1 Tax=Wickerhamomyces mucosus TaxID=1378264 RepID=A0A9P8TGM2_9ASCO|nr:hypothetical protein WICMUC_001700 [Wickerhamomyces mucosus]
MSFKFALSKYIKSPESIDKDQMLYYDDEFVVIKDLFPKAKYHYLLLPRSKDITLQNPLLQFNSKNLKFEQYRGKIQSLLDKFKSEILINLKLEYEGIDDNFVKYGVHAVPSLNNLHIHIISQDFQSVRLKNRHHYNSFVTEFFVEFKDLPLEKNDHRLNTTKMEYNCKNDDLICPYCDENFKNKFAKFKIHLKEEFENNYPSKT